MAVVIVLVQTHDHDPRSILAGNYIVWTSPLPLLLLLLSSSSSSSLSSLSLFLYTHARPRSTQTRPRRGPHISARPGNL